MKIKIIILFVVNFLFFFSCSPTKEERAQEMASNYLKGELYHFDSYEPLQTQVDSSFVALSTDKEAIELAMDMMKFFQSAQEYVDEIEKAESLMDISYGKLAYRRTKAARDENQQLLEKTKDRIHKQFSKIKSRQSYLESEALLKVGDFDGWMVYHKFKNLNITGSLGLFGEYVFLCDLNFNVKSAYSKREYDAISKVMTIISLSGDISEFIEKLQDEFL